MEVTRETVAGIIGGAVAVLLQIALAPSIALAAAVPNFCPSSWGLSSTWWAAARWGPWPLCSCW